MNINYRPVSARRAALTPSVRPDAPTRPAVRVRLNNACRVAEAEAPASTKASSPSVSSLPRAPVWIDDRVCACSDSVVAMLGGYSTTPRHSCRPNCVVYPLYLPAIPHKPNFGEQHRTLQYRRPLILSVLQRGASLEQNCAVSLCRRSQECLYQRLQSPEL
jgi:hypothetical protein